MELLQLRYFLMTAKYQHMTKAAEALHIAQPALSQSIHRLEEELGVPLFDRKNRGIQLNASGKLLEKKLRPIMSALDHLPAQLRNAASTETYTIRLNLVAASTMIINCIIEYKTLHPDIRFQLSQDPSNDDYDIGISSTGMLHHCLDGDSISLEEEFYLAVPSSSPYAFRTSIRLNETIHDSYISLDETRPLRKICDEFFQAAGFSPNIVFESDNPEAVRNLISAGLGIGFWPKYSWGSLKSPHVVLLPIESPVCKRTIVISCRKGAESNVIVSDFYHFILRYVSQL